MKTKIVSCHTADSKPVKQEVNSTVILPPLVFPALSLPALPEVLTLWNATQIEPSQGRLTEGEGTGLLTSFTLTFLYQLLFILTIFYLFTNKATFMRRSTVLTLFPQYSLDNLTPKVYTQTYIEQIAQVPLPSIEMMAKLTADDLELRLAKNTEIDSFML